jgi:hypothetical protein
LGAFRYLCLQELRPLVRGGQAIKRAHNPIDDDRAPIVVAREEVVQPAVEQLFRVMRKILGSQKKIYKQPVAFWIAGAEAPRFRVDEGGRKRREERGVVRSLNAIPEKVNQYFSRLNECAEFRKELDALGVQIDAELAGSGATSLNLKVTEGRIEVERATLCPRAREAIQRASFQGVLQAADKIADYWSLSDITWARSHALETGALNASIMTWAVRRPKVTIGDRVTIFLPRSYVYSDFRLYTDTDFQFLSEQMKPDYSSPTTDVDASPVHGGTLITCAKSVPFSRLARQARGPALMKVQETLKAQRRWPHISRRDAARRLNRIAREEAVPGHEAWGKVQGRTGLSDETLGSVIGKRPRPDEPPDEEGLRTQ